MSQAGALTGSGGGGGTVTSVTGANGVTAAPTTGAVVVSGINALADGATKGVSTYNATEFSSAAGLITSNAITTSLSGGLTGSASFNLGGTLTLGFAGGGAAIESVAVNKGGTNPVTPNGSGQISILGNFVAGNAGNNPVSTDGNMANGFTVEVQTATAQALSSSANLGLASFNASDFSVDANGFVSIVTGGFTWTDVTIATQALLAQNGYLTDRGGGVVYTLPASGSIGDEIRIVGKLGITTVTPRANQQILMASASGTVGVTGTIVGTNVGDCVTLICTTSGASTVWRASDFVGNWTVN